MYETSERVVSTYIFGRIIGRHTLGGSVDKDLVGLTRRQTPAGVAPKVPSLRLVLAFTCLHEA